MVTGSTKRRTTLEGKCDPYDIFLPGGTDRGYVTTQPARINSSVIPSNRLSVHLSVRLSIRTCLQYVGIERKMAQVQQIRSIILQNRESTCIMNQKFLQKGVDYVTRMNLYNLIFWMVILIPFLTQPPHERTLTGRGSRVYPNVGAAGCTLKVGAAGCTLTSGQPGAAWSGQEVCSGFALAACCMNSYYTICIKNVRIV